MFEVDEAALPGVAHALRPRVTVLGNLFRDQLDRYGELEAIASRWQQMTAELPGDAQLVRNGDDPLLASLEHRRPDPHVRDRRSRRRAPCHAARQRFQMVSQPAAHGWRTRMSISAIWARGAAPTAAGGGRRST